MNQFYEFNNDVNKRKEENKRRKEVGDKSRLKDNMKKKLQTTMIGAIAQFEESFGHLWGINKHVNELTESELEWREVWNDVRDTVLDLGNSQVRAAMNELEQYSLSWNKYQVNLPVKPRRRNHE